MREELGLGLTIGLVAGIASLTLYDWIHRKHWDNGIKRALVQAEIVAIAACAAFMPGWQFLGFLTGIAAGPVVMLMARELARLVRERQL